MEWLFWWPEWPVWVWLVVAYVAISVFIGIVDLARASTQEQYLMSFPRGDIGTYVTRRPIFGIHNWVFLPSWGVIILWLTIVRVINGALYD